MVWSEQVFRYCERGYDPSLWAEPLNVLSSLAFVAAAAIGAVRLRDARASLRRGENAVIAALIVLVACIGAGSVSFHMLATRWSQAADVMPIGLFMALYLAVALRVMFGWAWKLVVLGLSVLLALIVLAASACPPDATAPAGYCLNGTITYAPAWLALTALGAILGRQRHKAAPLLLTASAVFFAGMGLRAADLALCDLTRVAGEPRGLHALWHLLNAVVIYLLLEAALRAAPRLPDRAPHPIRGAHADVVEPVDTQDLKS